MKVVAYYALHYGKEWLRWSMSSVRNYVDDIIIVYSAKPSHGHTTDVQCPDTEDELRAIAGDFQAIWYTAVDRFNWEGEHRDMAVQLCEDHGADIILVVDHDEVWEPDMLTTSIEYVRGSTNKHYRVSMQHYYRSVGWVCHDSMKPVRFHNIKQGHRPEGYIPEEYGKVHHYGYAQSPKTVNYKWYIHGHLAELRPGWFKQKFLGWEPGNCDVHPVVHGLWTPEWYNRQNMEYLIGDHPYFRMGIIE